MTTRGLPVQPGQRASRVRKCAITRAVAVIWDIHVFIYQLIECEMNLMSIWIGILGFCFAIWHSFNKIIFKGVCCWHCGKTRCGCTKLVKFFFSQSASNVHGTCKLSVSQHQTISSSPMSWLSKNLSVALLEYYAFLTLDAFNEEFLCFSNFCCKINSEATFYALSVCETVCENKKTCHCQLSIDLCNETSVFYMVDVFEVFN